MATSRELILAGLWKMRLFLAFALLAVLGIALSFSGSSKATQPPQPFKASVPAAPAKDAKPDLPRLNVGVGYDGSSFVIVNLMNFDLIDLAFTIDPGIFEDGWSTGRSRLGARKPVIIRGTEFQKSNGARFNPFRDDPSSSMRIVARNAAGDELRTVTMIHAIR